MTEPTYLGLGTTLRSGPSELLARTAFAHELAATPYLWPGLGPADEAHVVALHSAGVIDAPLARRLVAGLRTIARQPLDAASLRPDVGDIYNNRDERLRAALGSDAGWIHAARARREATTIAWQLACRERLLKMGAALTDLGAALVGVARSHSSTLMSDFTYLHHAHPTTLGHYLLAHAYPVVRDIERAHRALQLVNRSPAGSGSVNGSRFAIDRGLLAELLGFDSVVEHTRDAMWAPDMALEALFAAGSAMTVVDRVAEELQLWTTDEFGYVELDDRHCRTSVVMPQKRNPYSLTWLRGQARFNLQMTGAVGATMQTISGQPDNRTFAYVEVPEVIQTSADAIDLLAEVLRYATFDRDRLEAAAAEGHAYATDVCDHLTLTRGIDNRSAHRLVGLAVRTAVGEGRAAIDAADLGAAAKALAMDLELPGDEELEAVISPAAIVASRQTRGGAAAGPMADMLADLSAVLEHERSRWRHHPLQRFPDSFAARIDAALA